tara:strand:+ start:1540 stop:2541 length:1002 start_codon:yes stop_codon:yes gene_type:complete
MKLKNFDLDKKVFIVAEIGNNHEGNFNNAKKLINLAAKAGADAVKFQTYQTKNFILKKNLKRFNQLKNFELTYEQFKSLKKIANKKKLKFISTPLDIESGDFLISQADAIKIASGDNNFFPLLERILRSKKKMIISTGITNIKQIKRLINFIYKFYGKKNAEKKIAFLHCVTSYPVQDKFANLRSIGYLKKNLKFTIGYSDHTIGNEACIAAVAMGARIIEKHITIDKKFSKFRDHAISADYKDLKRMISSIRKVEKQLGKFSKEIQGPEKKLIKLVRRGVYAKKNILKGEIITHKNSNFLRPSSTLDFTNLNRILGKKVKKNINVNQKIEIF